MLSVVTEKKPAVEAPGHDPDTEAQLKALDAIDELLQGHRERLLQADMGGDQAPAGSVEVQVEKAGPPAAHAEPDGDELPSKPSAAADLLEQLLKRG